MLTLLHSCGCKRNDGKPRFSQAHYESMRRNRQISALLINNHTTNSKKPRQRSNMAFYHGGVRICFSKTTWNRYKHSHSHARKHTHTTHKHTHPYMHAHTHSYFLTHTCTHFVHTNTHIHPHTHAHTQTNTHMYTLIHTCTH